jgi:hypothetical protein
MTTIEQTRSPEQHIMETYDRLRFDQFPLGLPGTRPLADVAISAFLLANYRDFVTASLEPNGEERTYEYFGLPADVETDQVEDLLLARAIQGALETMPATLRDYPPTSEGGNG